MSKSKRAISFLIAVLVLLGLMPLGMFADGPNGGTVEIAILKVDENEAPVEKGSFELYRAEREIDSPFMPVGEILATAEADGDGFVRFGAYSHGWYIVIEADAPEGYVKTDDTVVVFVETVGFNGSSNTSAYYYGKHIIEGEEGGVCYTDFDDEIEPIIGYVALVNRKAPTSEIVIKKVDENEAPVEKGSFELYRAEREIDSPFMPIGEKLATAEADGDGFVRFGAYPHGWYIVIEADAPEGYVKTDDTVVALVDTWENDGVFYASAYYYGEHIIADKEGGVCYTDFDDEIEPIIGYAALANEKAPVEEPTDMPSTDIVIMKVDEKGNKLSGGEFELYAVDYDDDTDEHKDTYVATTAAVKGVVKFENVPMGLYLVIETATPEEHLATNDEIWVQIEIVSQAIPTGETSDPENDEIIIDIVYFSDNVIEDEAGFTVSDIEETESTVGYAAFVNKKDDTVQGSIKIVKLDKDDGRLKGAKLGLYDTADNKIAEAVTGEDGIALFENLPLGKYVVKELDAPEGFKAMEEEFDVELTTEEADKLYALTNAAKDTEDLGSWKEIDELPPYESGDVDEPGELPEAGGTSASMILLAMGTPLISAGTVLGLFRRKRQARI